MAANEADEVPVLTTPLKRRQTQVMKKKISNTIQSPPWLLKEFKRVIRGECRGPMHTTLGGMGGGALGLRK